MMQYHAFDDQIQTTINYKGEPLNPLPFQLSSARLKHFVPELTGFSGFIHQLFMRLGKQQDDLGLIRTCLSSGEPAPAIVLSLAPLRVAVRATALDCAVVLDFTPDLVPIYGLRVGSRLLSVNNYLGAGFTDPELTPGPRRNPRWTHVLPLVVDFICDETDAIQRYKAMISDAEWQALFHAGQRILTDSLGARYWDGRPHLVGQSRAEAMQYVENHRSAQSARKIMLGILAAIILVPTLMCGGIGMLIRGRGDSRAVASVRAQASALRSEHAAEFLNAHPIDAGPAPTLPDGSPAPPPFSGMSPEAAAAWREAQEAQQRQLARMSAGPLRSSPIIHESDGIPVTATTRLLPGAKVYAKWGGQWWHATIVRADADAVIINYDGWSGEESASRGDLRIPK